MVCTLATLAASIAEAKLGSPGLLVVGEVVRHARVAADITRQLAA